MIYRIKDWAEQYENNRSRELKKLDWFAMPNKQDGDGYTYLVELENGAAIFGAWCACAQIASRCDPRGTLLRDNKKPHDAQSLARMSRLPAGIIQAMLEVCLSEEVNWLETIDNIEVIDLPAPAGEIPAPSREIPAGGCLEGKGREGKEGEGKKGSEVPPVLKLSERISLERELKAIGKELAGLGELTDHDRSDASYKRIVELTLRQSMLRKMLGVVA